jgi:hypothetical protein
MTDLTFIRPLVQKVLTDDSSEWTVQGFGFLRTYFGPPGSPKMFRLNLWDSRFTVPGVSTIHDHPWDLTSLIVAGDFTNQRYDVVDERHGPRPTFGATHDFATIKTGVGGGIDRSNTSYCILVPQPKERYLPGDTYHQYASEVHETLFMDGSVTLNKRIGDTEHARVFWPFGADWVDAMPRPATQREVFDAVSHSLKEWF